MADRKKKDLKSHSVFVLISLYTSIRLDLDLLRNHTAQVLHPLGWILFYLRYFYCTVYPDEGHEL